MPTPDPLVTLSPAQAAALAACRRSPIITVTEGNEARRIHILLVAEHVENLAEYDDESTAFGEMGVFARGLRVRHVQHTVRTEDGGLEETDRYVERSTAPERELDEDGLWIPDTGSDRIAHDHPSYAALVAACLPVDPTLAERGWVYGLTPDQVLGLLAPDAVAIDDAALEAAGRAKRDRSRAAMRGLATMRAR